MLETECNNSIETIGLYSDSKNLFLHLHGSLVSTKIECHQLT